MFELRCIVPDKKLGEALRALEPYALEPPVVKPGSEPTKNGNGHVPKYGTGGKIVEHFIAQGKPFTAKELRETCKASGLSGYAYSYKLNAAVKAKQVKAGANGVYQPLNTESK